MDNKYIKLSISTIIVRTCLPLLFWVLIWYSSPLLISTISTKKDINSYLCITLILLIIDNVLYLQRVIKNKRIYLEKREKGIHFPFKDLYIEDDEIISVRFKCKNNDYNSEYLEIKYKKNFFIRKILIKKGLCNVTLEEVSTFIKGYI